MKSEIVRLYHAFINSCSGIASCWKTEAAFRLQLSIFIITLPLICLIAPSGIEKLILVIVGMIALITEMLNTAIEKTIDRIGTDYHDLSKNAKDMGSAACFFAQITWFCSWLWIVVA
jgi:diacylglycerol kinase (ATP)